MKQTVASSKTEKTSTPYVHQQVADFKWKRLGPKVRAVAARSGVRAAIEYWSAHQFDFQDEYLADRGRGLSLSTAKTCATAIAEMVARRHANVKATSEIFDMSTRKEASIYARREVWFHLHCLPIDDKAIAAVWKTDVATVRHARSLSIRKFPTQTAQILKRSLEAQAKIEVEREAKEAAEEKTSEPLDPRLKTIKAQRIKIEASLPADKTIGKAA